MNTERVAGRHRNRVEVEELLRDYAGSGLSRREFCRSRGVGVSTLGHHLKRSRQELAGGQSQQIVAVELCSANSVQHHAVAEQSDPLLDQADSRCEGRRKSSGLTVVLKGDRCIEVQRGFDVGVLEQLVRALEQV